MTLSKCLKLSMTLFLVFMFCTSCQNNKGAGEYISLHELKSLSEKGTSLSWNDLGKYPFEDIGSGVYIRKYPIEGERQLLVRGKSLENPPEQISIVDSNGTEREFTPEIVGEMEDVK
ncbi:hypothetical protein MHH28_26300 [Paenibacillus sp. FSL K6-1217]|uniref:hypothetical protein n=1 Tax=Paenibacillus sp. FSL K6-1217 TaxID=2921466 RepID=UPI00325535D4